MSGSAARVLFILLLLLLAVFVPLLSAGYSELNKASTSGAYAEAAEHYQNAARRIPWRGDLYELAGHNYYYAKEYARAAAAYESAFQRHRLSPQGWVAWGDVVYLSGDTEGAVTIWEQAGEQSQPAEQLYSRLAEVYRSQADYLRAAEALQRYVAVHADDASGHYRLGLLLTLSDARRAMAELASAAVLDPEFGPAAETLRSALEMALQSPSESARYVFIGRGLGLVAEWELAHAAFESAVEADGENAEAWAWLGEANQQTGSSAAGIEELDRALALDPRLPAVRGLRGLYFQRIGNFRQALAEFRAAAALEPENPAWYISIGESYSKAGDLIRALEAYRTATRLAPGDPGYWRLLAIFCAQNNVNVRDAGVPAAQQAVVLAPEDPAALDVLGWLLLLDARYAEAERILTQTLELDPQNASAHLHLGTLYLQLNERAIAYDHLAQARDLGNQEAALALQQYFP